jgi:hypothetical protein
MVKTQYHALQPVFDMVAAMTQGNLGNPVH